MSLSRPCISPPTSRGSFSAAGSTSTAVSAARSRARRRGSAVDDVQLARRFVERDRAVRAADHDVLDPGAVFADEVDPGLDREGHPLAKRLPVAGDDVGVLVAFEADAVTGPVEEGVAIALRLDRASR